MNRKQVIVGFFLFILVACSQQEGIETNAQPISVQDVETVLTEQGFKLEKTAVSSDNVLIQELNGITPEIYNIDGNLMSVYVFASGEDRGMGIQKFEEKTATIELIDFKAYGIDNILCFYVSDDEKLQSRLFEALQTLNDPA